MDSITGDGLGTGGETGCCPRFDPEPWRDRQIRWHDKPFVRDRVHCVLHVPLDFGKVMTRNVEAVGDLLAPDRLVLCKQDSPWRTDLFLAVSGPVPGESLTCISGNLLATVHEGPFSQMGTFTDAAVATAVEQGFEADDVYFWYPTCPKCSKAYGEHYSVIFVGSATVHDSG